mgnify:CR=1 FL=1
MSHMVETMAYAGKTPWHGLGRKVKDGLSPDQMLKEAGLDWIVSKRPAYYKDTNAGKYHISPDWNLLVRESDNTVLGPCGKNYTPIQNREVFKFFNKFCKAGDMFMDTAGSLDNGRQVWGLANIRKGFTLPGGDDVEGHLLISHPHIWGKALTIMFTPIRVVCNNTLTMALNDAKSNQRFRVAHVSEFSEDVMSKAEHALGLADIQLAAFKEQSEYLAKKKYKEPKVEEFIARLYQPSVAKDKSKLDKFNRTAKSIHELIATQPGAKMSEGTWWSAFNAVTYHVDHISGNDRSATLNSAWFGAKSVQKRKALTMALEYAKAA